MAAVGSLTIDQFEAAVGSVATISTKPLKGKLVIVIGVDRALSLVNISAALDSDPIFVQVIGAHVSVSNRATRSIEKSLDGTQGSAV